MNIESNDLINNLPPEVVQELLVNCIESLAKRKKERRPKKDYDDASLGKLINEIIKTKQSNHPNNPDRNKDLNLKQMIQNSIRTSDNRVDDGKLSMLTKFVIDHFVT